MKLELNTSYPWMRTDGWLNHNGERRWWEVRVVILGWNGTGGWWLRKDWHHNGEPSPNRSDIETLGLKETKQLEQELEIVAAILKARQA